VKLDRKAEAKALLARAQTQLDEANEQDALDLADKALALHHTAQGYLVRARALRRLQRIDDALAAFDAAIELAPDSPEVYLERGWMLWSVKRYNEARPAFEKYLKLAPSTKDADDVRKALSEQP
jgi:tetratricopeptide (TPR) repeat protein